MQDDWLVEATCLQQSHAGRTMQVLGVQVTPQSVTAAATSPALQGTQGLDSQMVSRVMLGRAQGSWHSERGGAEGPSSDLVQAFSGMFPSRS